MLGAFPLGSFPEGATRSVILVSAGVAEAGNASDADTAITVISKGTLVVETGNAVDLSDASATISELDEPNVYSKLITSEHANKPNFNKLVVLLTGEVLAVTNLINQMQQLFDLDVAVGDQLDIVGQWIGITRFVNIPDNVFFSFDSATLGFDAGIWWEPYNPTTSIVRLPDDHYRVLLYAKVIANQWDGTIPGIYAAYQILFGPQSLTQVLVQDRDNMSMDIAIVGTLPDPLTTALITGGYLHFKPAGIRLNAYLFTSVNGAPLFGFDVANNNIAGFDSGCFATIVPGH